MNFAPFAVSTTNIFPCANSTAGAQLLSEFNLRSRESIATPQAVKYMIGPTYVHSPEDFSLSALVDDLGNPIGNNTVFVINEGRGVVNGHYFESLVPVEIDLAVANQYLVENGKAKLSGELCVGLRAMYSTEPTLAGSMLKENNKYYEGIHVVVLPKDQFKLPTDVPGINEQQRVTAHLWLGNISFINGRVTILRQNDTKCQMLPASRISGVEDMLGSQYLTVPQVTASKMYIYSGKVQNDTTQDPTSNWCDATESLMVWDKEPTQVTQEELISADAAHFVASTDGVVKLVIPHKQVDGGIEDTTGTRKLYQSVVLDFPVADYSMGTPGTVDKTFVDNIKSIATKINNFYTFSKGKQIAFLETFISEDTLPEMNPAWEIGDYIVVGQDITCLYEGSSARAPSTMYIVLPGVVKQFNTTGSSVRPDGVCLGQTIHPLSKDGQSVDVATLFELGNQEDGWNYRGEPGKDYFKIMSSADIPSLYMSEYKNEGDSRVCGLWYSSNKIVKSGNLIQIDRSGYANVSDTADDAENGSLYVYMPSSTNLQQQLGAAINLATEAAAGQYTLSYDYKFDCDEAAAAKIALRFYKGKQLLEDTVVLTKYSSLTLGNAWHQVSDVQLSLGGFDKVEVYFGTTTADASKPAMLSIDNIQLVNTRGVDCLNAAGGFCNTTKITNYYTVTECGPHEFSSPVWLTGETPLATPTSIGGFLSVPDTYLDGGYVRVNENGHLVLNDYALLRSGLLIYQLGEDFDTSAGLSAEKVQAQLDEYVNQRIAFPNEKHIANAENVNVINVTLNLSEETTEQVINVYDIDNRFNTAVYLHIRGTANGLTTINISDCAKLRLDIADECECIVNIARCNLYYDAHVLDRLNYIQDMELWYERFSESDEWLQVTGRTVSQIAGPVGWQDEDAFNSSSKPSSNQQDFHYQYALKGLTFSSSGTIIGLDLLVRNQTTPVTGDSGDYIHVASYSVPQASGLTYPETRLANRIKVCGRFVSVPSVANSSAKVFAIETDFVAVNETYQESKTDNSIHGTISFWTKVREINTVSGLGTANKIAGWGSDDSHLFHGEVSNESNT